MSVTSFPHLRTNTSPLRSTQTVAVPRSIRFSHRCMWAIVSKWRRFYRTLDDDHAGLLRVLPNKYKRRVVRSAVRTASFLYMLSSVVQQRFDERNALLAGILAALFDDLFDREFEDAATILSMLSTPGEVRCRSEEGVYFQVLFRFLLARLAPWQCRQLQDVLHKLADVEIENQNGYFAPSHWQQRGTAAFQVYLTVLGVPQTYWHQPAVAAFGEYLQLLDDYEDQERDNGEVNYFHMFPDLDLDEYYRSRIAPLLHQMLDNGAGKKWVFDADLFAEFIESYHTFIVDFANPPANRENSAASNGRAYPRFAKLQPLDGQTETPQKLGLTWLLWRGSYSFTKIWNNVTPRSLRLMVTRMIIRYFGWFIPF